jgi:hypothetical protein
MNEKSLKKGDIVVMFNCRESKGKNYGKLWTCSCDSFIREKGDGNEKVFLIGVSGSFACRFLQFVDTNSQEKKLPEIKSFSGLKVLISPFVPPDTVIFGKT